MTDQLSGRTPERTPSSPPPPPVSTRAASGGGGAASRAGGNGSGGKSPRTGGNGDTAQQAPVASRADEKAAASSPSAPGTRSPADRAAALWLTLSQRIAGRAAHEVKNALNAVAVNLEVVRSRLARAAAEPDAAPQPSPTAAARFADVASHQFESLSALAEAMLSLARAPREPADVVHLLAPLGVVFDAVARSDGGSLRVQGGDGGAPATVRVPAVVVRLALAAALDAAVGRGRAVTCVVDVGAGTGGGGAASPVRLRLSWLGAVAAPAVNADVVAAVGDCGVTIAPDESTSAAGAITIAFDGAPPACAGDDAPTAARPLGDAPPTKDQ